jgi:hypothetical protein
VDSQGPEFVATAVKGWIAAVGAKTAFIEKASPWENGYVESFNGKLRDELLDREVFHSLREAQVLIGSGRSPGRAPALQHRPAASRARLPTAGTRGPAVAGQQGWRPSDHHGDGAEIAPKLTSPPNHLVGAGQSADSSFHPSRPSGPGHLIQRKSLIYRPRLVHGAGRTPIHPGNPGSKVSAVIFVAVRHVNRLSA